MSTEIAVKRKLSDTINEYNMKVGNVDNIISEFEMAQEMIKRESCVNGTYGQTRIDTGNLYKLNILESLLKSAWFDLYKYLKIGTIASAADKKKFDQAMVSPPEFTIENIRASFGDYVLDPRGNIIRGLAEVFCTLDDFYKSHDKVKIGVKGLPKRVIISNVDSIYGWGKDQLENILNALAAYQGKPLIGYAELNLLMDDEDALLTSNVIKDYKNKEITYPARGVRLKRFKNGNGHLFFEPQELRDINMALAEFYGDVLPDCHEARSEARQESTEVSKDLQYYPTPIAVVKRVVDGLYPLDGQKVLEPSCGCGRFMDKLRDNGCNVTGIEVDVSKADEAISKGHKVLVKNFLETIPTADYDRVVMNPPFYGKHYAKHVKHAMGFLKPGGVLTAILPVTARYDHGLLDGNWQDLPVGSFRDSGTNVNTTILTIRKGR